MLCCRGGDGLQRAEIIWRGVLGRCKLPPHVDRALANSTSLGLLPQDLVTEPQVFASHAAAAPLWTCLSGFSGAYQLDATIRQACIHGNSRHMGTACSYRTSISLASLLFCRFDTLYSLPESLWHCSIWVSHCEAPSILPLAPGLQD